PPSGERRTDQKCAGVGFRYGDKGQADRIGERGGEGGKRAQIFARRGIAPNVTTRLIGNVKITTSIKRKSKWVSESYVGKGAEPDSFRTVTLHSVAVLIGDIEISFRIEGQAAWIQINARSKDRPVLPIWGKTKDAGVRAEVGRAYKNIIRTIHGQG